MMNRLNALVLLLVAIVLSNCDVSRQGPSHRNSRPLVIGVFETPMMLNPILSNFGTSSALIDIIFDGLVKIDEDMIAKPGLAESWEVSEDGLIWTFHIRQGVVFHDGTPLTADDVEFTLDVINNPLYNNQFSHIMASIKSIIVVDDNTIRFVLKHPFTSLPYYLYFGILPKGLYKGQDLENTYLNHNPVGTGPYKLIRWSTDELIFEANQNYFSGKPKIHTVVFRALNSQRATWAELMRGKVDFAWFLEPETTHIIKKLPHFQVYSYINPYYYILLFNNEQILFREKAVRQALNYAIDKNHLIQDVLEGAGKEVLGLSYPGSSFDTIKELAYPYDPVKALDLLNRTGWVDRDNDGILDRNGRKFQFIVYVPIEGFLPEKVAIYVQQQLESIGVHAQTIAVPLTELLERHIKTKQFEAAFWNFASIGDPDINYLFWSSSQIKSGLNYSSYNNRNVDRLLELGRASNDFIERKKIYNSFQREIFINPPGIFLLWRNLYIVLPENIKGVHIAPGGILDFINEWYYKPVERNQ